MKIDLITIFPEIVLDTTKWENGRSVHDVDVSDDVVFNTSRIFSYKKLSNPYLKIVDASQHHYIEEIRKTIIDSAGKELTDFVIILDKGVEIVGSSPPTTESQQLLTYFSYHHYLPSGIAINFIKIACFNSGPIYFFNNRDNPLMQKYSFLLPTKEDHQGKIKIHNSVEKVLLDIFSGISKKDSEKYKRLVNAIALFNESCRINPYSPNSSIVLMVSALESLMRLPRYSKKDNFGYAFKLLWGFDSHIEEWAKELYELRSQIVHGDVIEGERLLASKDHHYPHFKIAKEIFHKCLDFILEAHGDITLDRQYRINSIQALSNMVISNKEKVKRILKQRDKFTYAAFVKDIQIYRQFISELEKLTPFDYSADNTIRDVMNIISSIAKEWITSEKKKDYKNTGIKKTDKLLETYFRFTNQKYDNIIQLFSDIKNIKWSSIGRFRITKKLDEIIEQVRQIDSSAYYRNEFKFTVTEFLNRCLSVLYSIH